MVKVESVSALPSASTLMKKQGAASGKKHKSAQAQLLEMALTHEQVLHALELVGNVDASTIMRAMHNERHNLDLLFQERKLRETVIREIIRLYAEARKEQRQELRQRRHRVWKCCSKFWIAAGILLVLIALVMYLLTLQYAKGKCHLDLFTNFSCQHQNSCFFDVAVTLEEELLEVSGWRLPVEDWEQKPGKKRFDAKGPFKCCNNAIDIFQENKASEKQSDLLGSASSCCSLFDKERFLFCDNWGAHLSDCPRAPWACRLVVQQDAGKRVVKEIYPWVDPLSVEFLIAAGVSFGLAAIVQILPRSFEAIHTCLQLLLESEWLYFASWTRSKGNRRVADMEAKVRAHNKMQKRRGSVGSSGQTPAYSEEEDEDSDDDENSQASEVYVMQHTAKPNADSPSQINHGIISAVPSPATVDSELQKEKMLSPAQHHSSRKFSGARRSDAIPELRKPETRTIGNSRPELVQAVVQHQPRHKLQRKASRYTRRNSKHLGDADWGPDEPTAQKVFQPIITPAGTMRAENWRKTGRQAGEATVENARKTLERQKMNAMQMSQGQVQWLETTAALRRSACEQGHTEAPLIELPHQEPSGSSQQARASNRAALAKAHFSGRGRGRHLDRLAGLQARPRRPSI